jgi:hypothetical protein
MTAGDLIRLLKELPTDTPVVVVIEAGTAEAVISAVEIDQSGAVYLIAD